MMQPNQSPVVDIWQEFDCPNQGIDFDIAGADILAAGESVYCSGCGQYHTAEEAKITETMFKRDDEDAPIEFRGLPRSAEEKAQWLSEIQLPKA